MHRDITTWHNFAGSDLPNDTVFNVASRKINNDVSLLCIATGWPTPAYRWFKEIYKNDTLVEQEVDPLKDAR